MLCLTRMWSTVSPFPYSDQVLFVLNRVPLVVCQAPGNLHVSPGTKVAQLLNVGFDMCAWEIFSCLLNGGSLYLRGSRRADWIAVMKKVDVLICTPSILEPHDPKDYPNLKTVATAGEPCPKSLADSWAKVAQFYNCCGPTEVRHSILYGCFKAANVRIKRAQRR